jgi:hypothetical protein
MYPSYDDPDEFDTTLIDPFTGKHKHGHFDYQLPDDEPPRRKGCGNCATYSLILSLMALTAVVGALGAITFFTDDKPAYPPAEATFDRFLLQTETALAQLPPTVIPATHTNTPISSPTPTATPTPFTIIEVTPRPTATLTHNPTKTDTPTPASTWTPRPTESPAERFAFFAERFGFPSSVGIKDVSCLNTQSQFILTFSHQGVENVAYLEVVLQARGEGASFILSAITPPEMQITQPVTIALDDTILNLSSVASDDDFQAQFLRAWESERASGVTIFSVTWENTRQQPDIYFLIVGLHPQGAEDGVFMSVRWAVSPQDRPRDTTASGDREVESFFKVCQ